MSITNSRPGAFEPHCGFAALAELLDGLAPPEERIPVRILVRTSPGEAIREATPPVEGRRGRSAAGLREMWAGRQPFAWRWL